MSDKDEALEIGDEVAIIDEFGEVVTGAIVNTEAWGNEGQYAIGNDDFYGVYTRSADEITKL